MKLNFFIKSKYEEMHKMEYTINDVKKQFPQLKKLKDRTAIPILENLLENWLDTWDTDEMETMSPHDDPKLPPGLDMYVFAVDSKLVKVMIKKVPFGVYEASVSFDDGLRDYEFMGKAIFCGVDKKSVEKIYNQFKDFSTQQDLERIISRCSEIFKNVWSARYIDESPGTPEREIHDFYFK